MCFVNFYSQVLGILGALDPHRHKHNQQSLQGVHREGNHADVRQQMHSMEELPLDVLPAGGLFTTSEDYYSTVLQYSNSCVYFKKYFPDYI